jgi:hypothetical protein
MHIEAITWSDGFLYFALILNSSSFDALLYHHQSDGERRKRTLRRDLN